MELHILLAGVEFGPYTDGQVRELLGEGFLSETDPAKRLDETEWLPLSEVLAQSRAATNAPEEPTAEASAGEEEPAPPAATAAPEEEPAAEPPPEFEWPAPEPSGEIAAQETSPAPATVEEIEASEPEPEPPVKASPFFFQETDEETNGPSASAPVEESAPVETPAAKQEKTPARVAPPVAATRRFTATRQLTDAERTAFLLPATTPLPSITTAPTSVLPVPASVTTAPPPRRAAPAPITLAPAASAVAAPIVSTIPLLQVSLPAKAKKAVRTGALLARDSLRAARNQQGLLPPTEAPAPDSAAPPQPAKPVPPVAPTPEAPAIAPEPAEKTTPAPSRKLPLILRGREETQTLPAPRPSSSAPAPTFPAAPTSPSAAASAPAPATDSTSVTTSRKAIRLTGRITLPGLAPKPELPPSQPPSLSGPLVISRPARTGAGPKGRATRPLTAREKSSFLVGQIARPADVARQETAAETAGISTAPVEEIPAPAREEEIEPTPVQAAGEETVARELAPPESARGSVTALLRAAGTEMVAAPPETPADSGALPPLEEPPTEADLTDSGRLTSSGDLAERRSLKITGPLRHPLPRPPIRLSSPSKPGESSRLPYPGRDRPSTPALPLPEAAPEPPPLPPAPEESLPLRPQTGKIPVSAMPTEGIRIRTRRSTGKIPVPEKERAPEPLSARATPPPPLPEEPAAISAPAAEPKTISVTPPRAEPALVVTPPAEPLPVSGDPTVFSGDAPALPGPEMAAESSAPTADAAATEFPEAPTASPADAAEARGAATPDKIRLRRPVKLELSSRAKIQESGRLTLEAFSKMASLELPDKTAPAAGTAIPTAKETPASPAEPGAPISPPGPTAPSSTAAYDRPRLEEAPPLAWKSAPPKTAWRWEWLSYAVITFLVVAVCAIVYILAHRSGAGAASAPVATSGAATPSSVATPPPPPASAAPPETSAAPPPSAAVPAPSPVPVQPPATNAAPTASIQDLNHQVDADIAAGIQKYQHGDLVGALGADNQALDLDSKSAAAFFNRGLVKAAQGDFDGAVADYSAALQIDPNMAPAYYRRGLVRHQKAELDGALSDYNQTLQIDPKNAPAYYDRGMIRMQKDDIDGAIVDATRALELDPRQISAYYDRGLGRLAKGSLDSALGDMKTFCQIAPQDAFTDYARLYIWLIESQQGHLAEANQELAQAMNNSWNGAADSMVTRIGEFLLGQIGENELIKASASAIPVKDQGQRCEAWYFIGMRRLQAGDKTAAIDDLQKCVDTQKTDYCEYILAQEELKNLNPTGTDNTAPPPPPRAQPVTLPDPGTMAPNASTSDSAPEGR